MQDNETLATSAPKRATWNKSKLTGAKPPLRPKHVWSIRTKLQMADRKRDLALFSLAEGRCAQSPAAAGRMCYAQQLSLRSHQH